MSKLIEQLKNTKNLSISYQGEEGANSHIACMDLFPNASYVNCVTFDETLQKVISSEVNCAVIPIENSVAGRVADIHHLLPESGLQIVGEYFLPLHHQLLGIKGASLKDITHVHSHMMALAQCRKKIVEYKLTPVVGADTAGSAKFIAQNNDKSQAAIASSLAAKVYDLEILEKDIEDTETNTTRFVIVVKNQDETNWEDSSTDGVMTSFLFQVRNIPSALYKALGGFATNGINMTKLESYMLDGSFSATQFYAEVDGHPNNKNMSLALEELDFFTDYVKILGVYKAHWER